MKNDPKRRITPTESLQFHVRPGALIEPAWTLMIEIGERLVAESPDDDIEHVVAEYTEIE